jgi:hypothetical protein
MSHRTVITNLTQGQSAWVSGLGSQSFGNMYQLASFKGFLYSPPQGVKVVWWAFRTVGGGVSRIGSANHQRANQHWQRMVKSSMATIPASAPGIYYIVYGGVTQSNTAVNVYLYLNGTCGINSLVSQNTATSIYREGAHMAPLASGTTVSIRVVSGNYDNSGYGHTWISAVPSIDIS